MNELKTALDSAEAANTDTALALLYAHVRARADTALLVQGDKTLVVEDLKVQVANLERAVGKDSPVITAATALVTSLGG